MSYSQDPDSSFCIKDEIPYDPKTFCSNRRKDSLNKIGFFKPKMLFVNDSPLMIDMYRNQFEDYFEVELAENGLQAV